MCLRGLRVTQAEHHGGGVAETVGGPGVGALMDAEGKDENDYLEKE